MYRQKKINKSQCKNIFTAGSHISLFLIIFANHFIKKAFNEYQV